MVKRFELCWIITSEKPGEIRKSHEKNLYTLFHSGIALENMKVLIVSNMTKVKN